MKTLISVAIFLFLLTTLVFAQGDPAFEPPAQGDEETGGRIRFNGAIGMVVINGKIYQQFGFRPDIPFGKFGVGLDLTFRFDEEGNLKEDEWDDGMDYLEKIYYLRYGKPGDPFHVRIGALDNVTLGYGIIMKRYCNTIQYPEIKRLGFYSEGHVDRIGWQAMLNSFRELDQPGLMGTRLTYETGLKGLTVGAAVAHDGNQFAGLPDQDNDGVPDPLDVFPDVNDFDRQAELRNLNLSPGAIDTLIMWGLLPPNVRGSVASYKNKKESVTIVGADVGIPLIKERRVSLWVYAQVAKIVDFGWGSGFPGARLTVGPLEIGAEYRHYEKQFQGEFFNYPYEIERVQYDATDSIFVTKEKRLEDLGAANGYYADAALTILNYGYIYGWYLDMHGANYPNGKTLYGEAGVTPPPVSRVQRVAGYYMQPNVKRLFDMNTDGTIYGAKVYFSLAPNVSLVYDHRISFYNGERHRTVRVETMMSF
jgi:hypothetical protein